MWVRLECDKCGDESSVLAIRRGTTGTPLWSDRLPFFKPVWSTGSGRPMAIGNGHCKPRGTTGTSPTYRLLSLVHTDQEPGWRYRLIVSTIRWVSAGLGCPETDFDVEAVSIPYGFCWKFSECISPSAEPIMVATPLGTDWNVMPHMPTSFARSFQSHEGYCWNTPSGWSSG